MMDWFLAFLDECLAFWHEISEIRVYMCVSVYISGYICVYHCISVYICVYVHVYMTVRVKDGGISVRIL